MRRVSLVVLAILVLLVSVPYLSAQESEGDKASPKLEGNTIVGKVIKKGGQEKILRDTSNVGPGSTLEYKMEYKNIGDAPAYNPTLVNRIPQGTVYLQDSEESDAQFEVKFSADSGKTYSKKPMRKIKNKEGEIVSQKPIPPKEFTHIKWRIDGKIEVEEEVTFKYRVKVLKK